MSLIKTTLVIVAVAAAGLLMIEAIRLLMLKHSVATYSHYWKSQAQLSPAKDSLLYVAMGDSAAQGIGASRPQNGYVGLVTKGLAAQSLRPVHVTNLSVTGATIGDLLSVQLPVFLQMQLPKDAVVTVEIGANDLANFNETNFANQVEQLCSKLPVGTIIADIPYFGGGRAKSREPNALIASQIIAQSASRHKLRVAPLHATTKAGDGMWIYGADFFHPNDKGYRNWYQAFAQVLGL